MMKVKLVTFVIMLLITIGIWVFPRPTEGHRSEVSPWVAGVPGRTIPLCVAHEDGTAVNDTTMAKVIEAFVKASAHSDFVAAGLDRGDGPRVVAGCGSAAAINTSRGSLTVSTPGAIQAYMFIVSTKYLEAIRFKHYPRVVGHEQICSDGVCNSVSNAVYITAKELDDPRELENAILSGLGLSTSDLIYVDGVSPDNKLTK